MWKSNLQLKSLQSWSIALFGDKMCVCVFHIYFSTLVIVIIDLHTRIELLKSSFVLDAQTNAKWKILCVKGLWKMQKNKIKSTK